MNFGLKMSENPNHYVMIYGVIAIILVIFGAIYGIDGVSKNVAIGMITVMIVLGVGSVVLSYLSLKNNYDTHNSLDLNLKRKELGFELKVPKWEKKIK